MIRFEEFNVIFEHLVAFWHKSEVFDLFQTEVLEIKDLSL